MSVPSLSKGKAFCETLQAVCTIGAILVGGWWTYTLFVENRKDYPRAKISHHILYRGLGINKDARTDTRLVHVTVTVANTGEVLVTLANSEVRVQQILPCPRTSKNK